MVCEETRQEIIKKIKKELGLSIDELKIIKNILLKYKLGNAPLKLKNEFSYFSCQDEFGIKFTKIYKLISSQDYNTKFKFLSEKCINRDRYIKQQILSARNEKQLELAKMAYELFTIILYVCPIELLYMMEYQKNNNVYFDDFQNLVLEYLQNIAAFYLKETDNIIKKIKKNELHKGV